MIESITSSTTYGVLFITLGAFVLTYYLIPKIIKVVNHKELMEHPNQRSSHITLTPTFGGISFFIILILTVLVINPVETNTNSLHIVAALTILLFTGLKDDLVVISYTSKIIGQLAAIGLFLIDTDFYKINLQGFLGINELGVIAGVICTVFLMLAIINAFNLIDGIDGLSATVAIVCLTFYGIIFYQAEEVFFLFICVSLIGSLIAFLRFNLSSNKKIFMGDTGSLIIGFIIAVMTLKVLNFNESTLNEIGFIPKNIAFIVSSILVFPLFDTLRILMVRIRKKQNLFLADRNHIHHLLLELGFSHTKSSIIISLSTLIFTLVFLYLTTIIENIWIISGAYFGSLIIIYLLIFKLSRGNNNQN